MRRFRLLCSYLVARPDSWFPDSDPILTAWLTKREQWCQSVHMVIAAHEQRQIDEIIERLTRRYPDVSHETVSEVVHELHSIFAGAPVREFVGLFVERRARAALEELSVSYDRMATARGHRHAPVA